MWVWVEGWIFCFWFLNKARLPRIPQQARK
jgi:hypothetical protein